MRVSSFVLAAGLTWCGAEGPAPGGAASGAPGESPPTGSGLRSATAPVESAQPRRGASSASAAVPMGDVLPEMVAFLAMLDGSDDCVPRALRKHGKNTLDDKDMSMYMLRDARVVATDEKSDTKTCYDFEAQGGSVTYTFEGVCWEGGKIVSVKRERPQP